MIAFAADVHVRSSDDERARRFIDFLARPEVRAAFVLGDLFDFWFEKRGFVPSCYRSFLERLKGLGKRVYVLSGNWDYLLGRAFERASGARVLGQRRVLKLGKERVLLTHGDEFCRMDVSHHAWRIVAQSQVWRRTLKSCPEAWADPVLAGMASVSHAGKRRKSRETLSVSLDAVELELARGVGTVICGHVHEAGEVKLRNGRLLKLGWWAEGGEVAVWDGELSLVSP